MLDVVSIASAVGTSGVAAILYNLWTTKRLEKNQKNTDKRNENREPLIVESLQLGNVSRVTELLRQGLDESEERRKRDASDFGSIKAAQDITMQNLKTENDTLRNEMYENRKASEEKIDALQKELIDLHMAMRKLKEMNSGT